MCTYHMHAASELFPWSMEFSLFAGRLFVSVIPFIFSLRDSEAGGTALFAKLLI